MSSAATCLWWAPVRLFRTRWSNTRGGSGGDCGCVLASPACGRLRAATNSTSFLSHPSQLVSRAGLEDLAVDDSPGSVGAWCKLIVSLRPSLTHPTLLESAESWRRSQFSGPFKAQGVTKGKESKAAAHI